MEKLTEEQNKAISKLQNKFLFSSLWSTVKVTPVLFLMNLTVLVVDKLYVNSAAFRSVMVLTNIVMMIAYLNKDFKKNFENLQKQVLDIIK